MIPHAKDTAILIGEYAEHVENRSLLYEKFSFPKVWGQPEKVNDASRWSVLRIVTRGSELLREDARRKRLEASGREVRPDKAERLRREAGLAEKLANVAPPDPCLIQVAAEKSRRLLQDLERAYGGRVVTFEATLGGRLLVNLAGGVVENAGICLDRCFGLPFLPGTAIKGIARCQALWEIREADPEQKIKLLRHAMILFGYGKNDVKPKGAFGRAGGAGLAMQIATELGAQDFKGVASFLPAYPTTPPKLVVDMVNPHYPEYYRGKRTHAEDNESPIPNYFPAVEAGSGFGFAVILNRLNIASLDAVPLLQQAKAWLENALTQKGAGAKTGAGYGWFALRSPLPEELSITSTAPVRAAAMAPSFSPEDALIEKWRGKLNTKDNFPAALPELAAIAETERLHRVFEAVIPENERRKTRKNSPYWQAFTNGRHAEAGKKILQRLEITLT